ncbi:MAG: M20/M25/M40 family metallo-hydrolase [Paenibacillaceae bacterium]|nr:M20/M25/M40 family metallo-hydrolase [Paenibacillaceae bacterium]
MIVEERLIGTFMELVRVDSETKHEQAIAAELKRRFAALGVRVAEDDTATATGHGAGNLIGTLEATADGAEAPVIFFTCHMDTVAPGNGIKPQLDADGIIRSDGTTVLGSDDKAGIAAILEAILAMQEQGIPHGRIQIIITAGEESGLVGARAMDAKWLEAEFGFALDSNGSVGDIAVAAPAQAKIDIVIMGKSAHAGVNPEDGVSAITVASKAVSRMPLGRIDHETTANIGSFAGGGATNVVCDHVVLKAEARSLDNAKLERQVAAMRQASESAATEMGAAASFASTIVYPAYKHDVSSPVVQLAMTALASIGKTPRPFHSGGGSDANIFNGLGVPTVNLAVGYQKIHTKEESIAAADIVDTARAIIAIVQEAAKQRKRR